MSFSAGFVEFGPEIAGSDQTSKLLLSSDDPVRACCSLSVHCYLLIVTWQLHSYIPPLRTLHLGHISSLMLAWYKEGTVFQVLFYSSVV